MHFTLLYSTAALATLAFAGPIGGRGENSSPHEGDDHDDGYHSDKGHYGRENFTDFSPFLSDGFPNPSPVQIIKIQERAHGTLPNSPLPTGLSNDSITSFQLIALNEIAEVAFFYELVQNISNNVEGYKLGEGRDRILENLNIILGVEELHALGANAILQANGADPIQPCKYNFPVSDYKSAIDLAATVTDLVVGTLQDVADIFAQNTENGAVRLLSSVIGDESQQEGLFRIVQKKATPAQPFVTTSTRNFVFTALQGFIVPGSCLAVEKIALQTFNPLNVLTPDIKPKTQELEFSFSLEGVDVDVDSLSLVLVNALNKPIVEQLEDVKVDGETVIFTAKFPFDEFLLHGLTIAAVTNEAQSFPDAIAVANQTVFGPGLIEVN